MNRFSKSIFLTFLFSSILYLTPYGQVQMTKNGYAVPNRGTLRVLLVYAEVDYSMGNCPNGKTESTFTANYNAWGTSSGETTIPSDAGVLFENEFPFTNNPPGFVSDLYFQSSFGEYIILGDYIPKVVKVPCSNLNLFGVG